MARKKSKSQTPKETNLWDFLIHVCDKVYNLLKFGHVFSAMILVLLICILIVIVRFPSNELPILTTGLFSFLGKEKFYLIPISTLTIISLVGNYFQHKIYSKEINRICDLRKKLIHGTQDGTLTPIDDHRSSILTKEVVNAPN